MSTEIEPLVTTLPVPLHTKIVFFISCVMKSTDIKTRIGSCAYSYFFVYRAFKPLLEKYCIVREIANPETQLDFAAAKARSQGLEAIHLAFFPLQDVYVSSNVPTIAFPFFEFPDIPNTVLSNQLRNNWEVVGQLLAGIITACEFTKASFLRSRVNRPITVLPVPIKTSYFELPTWDPNSTTELECGFYILKPKTKSQLFDRALKKAHQKYYIAVIAKIKQGLRSILKNMYHRLKHYIPEIAKLLQFYRSNRQGAQQHIKNTPAPTPWQPEAIKLKLSGIIFTSIFSPFDGRKNWQDILSAAITALRDKPDATIVLKLVVMPEHIQAAINMVQAHYDSLDLKHQCKVILIPVYCSEQQLHDLTQASAFYINASRAEGACLPLQDFLAAGRPAIAPNWSAMADYFDNECGFVVNNSVEPTYWPHDPELKMMTTWAKIEWGSLRDGITAAYKLATNNADEYQQIALKARSKMRNYASNAAVWPKMLAALDLLVDASRNMNLGINDNDINTDTACYADNEPIYFEADALFHKHLTGIGRFAARLMEATARARPICLFTANKETLDGEILITSTELDQLEAIDIDVQKWAKSITSMPRRASDLTLRASCVGVYPMLRPEHKMFRKELGILYDFTPTILPWSHASITIDLFTNFFTNTAQLFDAAIAISNSTKSDARWNTTLSNEKIIVRYPGPSLCDQKHAHELKIKSTGKIILVVATLEPRKNAAFLLEWFLNSNAIESDTELWWVGSIGWGGGSEFAAALEQKAASSKNRKFRLLGVVSDAKLCSLYQSAMLTIYPSLYEGFGFPVLDSMMHETPVLCSYNSSLQEFALPGVFFFDACDAASLDTAYLNFLAQQSTVQFNTQELREQFSWDVFAQSVIQL